MPHVRAETLARFRQGDLSPGRSTRISAHLARCHRCTELNGALAGVTTLLASASPPPMPEHLAARIQNALASEAAARRAGAPARNGTTAGRETTVPAASAPAGTPPSAPGRPSGHQRPARRAWGTPRIALGTLAAAAGVAVVAVGGYALIGHSGSSSSPSAAAGSAHAPASEPMARPSGGPARDAPIAPGNTSAGPALAYRYAGQEYLVTAVASGTDYTADSLARQAAAEAARYGAGGARSGPNAMTRPGTGHSPAPGSDTFGNLTVRTLTGCVDRIAAGQRVLLVDVARFQGAAATVIVTGGSAGRAEEVWVAGAGCSASRGDVLKHTAATPAG